MKDQYYPKRKGWVKCSWLIEKNALLLNNPIYITKDTGNRAKMLHGLAFKIADNNLISFCFE